VVANRTLERAERVAAAVGGEAVPLDLLPGALASADLVVSCTGAVGHVLDTELLRTAVAGRPDRPLVVLDLALPRDVDPAAHDLPGVTVVDLETLAGALATSEHAADVEATREIVVEEVAAFLGWQRAVSVAPTVVALRDMADAVVRAELVRLSGRLPELDPHARAEIEQTVTRVVDKLLHAPTVRVKQLAEEPGGQSYADALNKLFGLDPKAVEAVTRADVATDPTPGGAS
jgi:glutamyl-tRNA reductase